MISYNQHGKVIAEYVWIDGSGRELRSKQRTLDYEPKDASELPEWNYDGSSCYQATTSNSEILLIPRKIYPDPFRGEPNILVMCETYKWTDNTFTKKEPTLTNFRHYALEILEAAKEHEPWYGIQQEYVLFEPHGTDVFWPAGWPLGAYLHPQGEYYCGNGAHKDFGRKVMEQHYKACLHAKIKISGTNGEVMPAQWEFQIGPSLGIDIGDDLWMARYLLSRIAGDNHLAASLQPKPVKGDWNGSGCHTNFSTKAMREEGGYEVILDAVKRLEPLHKRCINVYGDHNDQRLCGRFETSSLEKFGFGAGHRGQSIRIPTQAIHDKKGYFQDRRPAANIDPYVVAAVLIDATAFNGERFGKLEKRYNEFMAWKVDQEWYKNNTFY